MLDGQRVDATKHTRESWLALQSSKERKLMVMPLCGVRAVAKSRGETQFFAHLSIAGCDAEHGGETPQHLAMKEALALGIDRTPGWHDGIFPVWLVPRGLEYSPISVPTVVTGFSKTSDIPEDIEQLLRTDVEQKVIRPAADLAEFIRILLLRGPHWPQGSPARQAQARQT